MVGKPRLIACRKQVLHQTDDLSAASVHGRC